MLPVIAIPGELRSRAEYNGDVQQRCCVSPGTTSSLAIIGQAGKDVGEPGAWVKVVDFAGLDQRVNGGGTFAAIVLAVLNFL